MLAGLIRFQELYTPGNKDIKVCFNTVGFHDNYNGNQEKVKHVVGVVKLGRK